MSAIQQLPKPEQLVDLVSHAAAVKLAMDGEFDAKIAELKAAKDALAEATDIAQTLEQAKKIKDDADAYAAATWLKASEDIARAQNATDKAASRETLVAGREQSVAAREAAADQRQATQDTREQAILDAQNGRDAALTARENAVKNAEADIKAKRKQLANDQDAFNRKLEALKA